MLTSSDEFNLLSAPSQLQKSTSEDEINSSKIVTSGHETITNPTTPIASEAASSTVRITTLPSIPERSTYRIELQPGVVLPPRKFYQFMDMFYYNVI